MQSYFDPKTGELIGGEIGAPSQPQQQNQQQAYQQDYQTNYQLNQPDYQQGYQQNQPNYQQNQPINQQPKKPVNKKIFIGIGIGCGVVVLAGVLIFVISQLLTLNPVSKITTAAVNTFKISKLQEVLNPVGVLDQDGIAFEALVEAEGNKVSIAGAYQQSKQRKDVYGKMDLDVEGEELAFEGTIELDKERLAISIPELDDVIYTYYYTRENEGFLAEEMDEDDLEMLNEVLQTMYEAGYDDNSKEFSKAVTQIVMEELQALELEELDKEEFEINDKDVECGGYMLTVTADNMLNVIDQLADAYDEYYGDSMEALEEMGIDMDELWDDLEYTFEDMPDIEISFYIYKKQFASIMIEMDGEDEIVYLNFHGGDYPAQNMEMVVEYDGDEYTVFETEGSVKNQVETLTFIVDDEELCEMNYNQKTGELEIVGDEYLELELNAVVNRKGNTITVELEDMEIEGVDLSASFMISGDTDIKALKGEEFDLGNADEDDWEDLGEDLMDLDIISQLLGIVIFY